VGDTALWFVETIVAAAIDGGCSQDDAVALFRSIWYYTVGEILVRSRSGRGRAEDGRPADSDTIFTGPDPSLGRLDPSRHPHLAAIGDRWLVLASRDTYPQGLRALVDGMLAQAGPRTP
jgi:hypothetical protein